jgi:hypothetical protein
VRRHFETGLLEFRGEPGRCFCFLKGKFRRGVKRSVEIEKRREFLLDAWCKFRGG